MLSHPLTYTEAEMLEAHQRFTDHLAEKDAIIADLTRMNEELRDQLSEVRGQRGVASNLIRLPENYHVIDDVLEKVKDQPFSINEVFNKWIDIAKLKSIDGSVQKALKQHFVSLLKNNGFICKTGGKGRRTLYRLGFKYNFPLRSAKSLIWRKTGENNGLYLIPEIS